MLLVKKIMKVFQKFFNNVAKLNANEVAFSSNGNKYQQLDNYLIKLNKMVDNLSPVIGWTNPEPKKQFNSQTITTNVNFSDYTYYEIIYRGYSGNATCCSTGKISVNDGALMLYAEGNTVVGIRQSDKPSGKTIKFGSTSGTNVSQSVIVPQQIIFYK